MQCLAVATEICSIMKMIAYMDLSIVCSNVGQKLLLIVASSIYTRHSASTSLPKIFAQVSKTHPEDDSGRSSLRFLLLALGVLKELILLAESYLLHMDFDRSSLAALQDNVKFSGLEKSLANILFSFLNTIASLSFYRRVFQSKGSYTMPHVSRSSPLRYESRNKRKIVRVYVLLNIFRWSPQLRFLYLSTRYAMAFFSLN
jgi:hypothetical protein